MGLGRESGGPHPRPGSITCVQCPACPAATVGDATPEEGNMPAPGVGGGSLPCGLLGELRPGGGAGSQPELGGKPWLTLPRGPCVF